MWCFLYHLYDAHIKMLSSIAAFSDTHVTSLPSFICFFLFITHLVPTTPKEICWYCWHRSFIHSKNTANRTLRWIWATCSGQSKFNELKGISGISIGRTLNRWTEYSEPFSPSRARWSSPTDFKKWGQTTNKHRYYWWVESKWVLFLFIYLVLFVLTKRSHSYYFLIPLSGTTAIGPSQWSFFGYIVWSIK